MDTRISRREALERVVALVGGIALVDGDRLLAASFEAQAQDAAMSAGVGDFTAADVALLDEIAETILPATDTPGAKAAKTGAFMALMVTSAYTPSNQEVFRAGLRTLNEECRRRMQTSFMEATGEQRLALLELLDREQLDDLKTRETAPRSRAPAPEPLAADAPVHYFRMMKQLALLGYFTSEIGVTQAQRYVESPGRFDPCVPYSPGEKSWAQHA